MINIIMQAPAPQPGNPGFFLVMMIVLFIFMYFMSIRPQQQRMKAHKLMLENIVRGDVVVTNGGLIGKVKKVNDDELTIDLGGTEVKAVRTMIADVRNRTLPANDTAKAKGKKK